MALGDLDELLANLSVQQRPGSWCMVSDAVVPAGVTTYATVVEDEGVSFVLNVNDAVDVSIRPEAVFAWLTLGVHSSLGAVGLVAAVATALAAQNIPCNVLAGFHHDHLLVPIERSQQAISILELLSREHQS